MKKRTILLSVLSIIMCLSLTVGGTFALFTSKSEVNIAVTSANIDVKASVTKAEYSFDSRLNEASNCTYEINSNDGSLDIEYMMPGDTITATVSIENESNIAIKYKVTTEVSGDLKDYLLITPAEKGWTFVEANGAIETQTVVITLPYEATNDAQTSTANVLITVQAIQGNVNFIDEWDGATDISWFLENSNASEYTLSSAEELAGLAALVDGTAAIPADGQANIPDNFDGTFAGVTFTLNSDVDLEAYDENGNRILFEPIGDASNADFSGVFDGNGHTIYNLRQDCNAKHVALFGAVYKGTVKNLVLEGALVENDGSGYAALICAYAGDANFENITLRDSTVVNYNHNTAGIVAWCSNNGTTTTFDGINIESSTTIGSWWGSYDTRVGGIVGAMNTGNNVVIKNSTIACQLDVYNDVTSNYQWWNYRTAGMVVADVRDNVTIDGRTQANPARVTCENVTVIFGDWANYHYCESASYGKPSYASEGEYKFIRVEAGLGYGGIDLSACNHAEDESHNELIEFNYLFGARDGKGIYGISEFEGVNVIYNNK